MVFKTSHCPNILRGGKNSFSQVINVVVNCSPNKAACLTLCSNDCASLISK